MFTLNNPDGLITIQEFAEWKAKYLVYQEEIAPSTGTHHLQGYIEMPRPVRFSHFKSLEGAHFDICKGTQKECKDYCTKIESRVGGPYEFGELSGGQGSRTDCLQLRNACRAGASKRELYDDDVLAPAAIKFGRAVDDMQRVYRVARPREDLEVCHHPSFFYKCICTYIIFRLFSTTGLQVQESPIVPIRRTSANWLWEMDSGSTTTVSQTFSLRSSPGTSCPLQSSSSFVTSTLLMLMSRGEAFQLMYVFDGVFFFAELLTLITSASGSTLLLIIFRSPGGEIR